MSTASHTVLPLTIDDLLTTTRAVRRRLDLERPVERSVVEECLRLAFQAPTGSNAQNWGWVLIDDPETRAKVGEIYNEGYRRQREIFPVDGPVQPVNLSGNHLHKKRVNPLVDVMGKGGCGWMVEIQHAGNIMTRYCHMVQRPFVKEGQQVQAGQVIGRVGTSGNSSGPHLHFEVHLNDDRSSAGAINPVPFMKQQGAPLGGAG